MPEQHTKHETPSMDGFFAFSMCSFESNFCPPSLLCPVPLSFSLLGCIKGFDCSALDGVSWSSYVGGLAGSASFMLTSFLLIGMDS